MTESSEEKTAYGLSEAVQAALLTPLRADRVADPKDTKFINMESYEIRAHLNRMFGFAGWSGDVLDSWLVAEHRYVKPGYEYEGRHVPESQRVTVIYRVRYQLTIKDAFGNVLATYTEEATGDAPGQPFPNGLAGAHDMAIKTAESQALKRAAMNLGDQFGLSLYAGYTMKTAENNGGRFPALVRYLVSMLKKNEEAPSLEKTKRETNVVPPRAPEEEQSWVDQAEALRGDRVAVGRLWNEARSAKVTPTTLAIIEALGDAGEESA